MLHEKNMPMFYCAEATSTTVYIMNRCTTTGAHELTPHEVYAGKRPTLSHLRVFGSIAYVHLSTKKRQKLDMKSKKCIFVGYSSEKRDTSASTLPHVQFRYVRMLSVMNRHLGTHSFRLHPADLDKGKGKMPEYEVEYPDESDSDVSARSLDGEFEVPIMRTPDTTMLS